MTCPEVVSYLDELADGELSPERSAEVRNHIDRCESCRREYELTRRIKDVLAGSSTPDPGQERFRETENLILARTVGSEAERGDLSDSEPESKSSRRWALVRAVLSVAASLALLFGAIYIGTSDDAQQVRQVSQRAPVLATADVRQLVGDGASGVFTQADQMRIARGMMMLGSPGLLGRFSAFPEFSRTNLPGES